MRWANSWPSGAHILLCHPLSDLSPRETCTVCLQCPEWCLGTERALILVFWMGKVFYQLESICSLGDSHPEPSCLPDGTPVYGAHNVHHVPLRYSNLDNQLFKSEWVPNPRFACPNCLPFIPAPAPNTLQASRWPYHWGLSHRDTRAPGPHGGSWPGNQHQTSQLPQKKVSRIT